MFGNIIFGWKLRLGLIYVARIGLGFMPLVLAVFEILSYGFIAEADDKVIFEAIIWLNMFIRIPK